MELNPSAASSSSRTDRKTIERNRRNQMKSLFSMLNTLVPRNSIREVVSSLPDQLDEATKYIKKLQMNFEKLKEKKHALFTQLRSDLTDCSGINTGAMVGPIVRVHQMGLALEVSLITSVASQYQFQFDQVVAVLQEEGAEVVTANFCVVGNRVFHSFHSKVVGQEMSLHCPILLEMKISERLAR